MTLEGGVTEVVPAAERSGAVSSAPERETGTVRRVLLLLGTLADHPGESAQRLAGRLNLPRSTVHRLLTMLRANGFADVEPDGSFGPGLELLRIAGRVGARMPYRKLAEPYLQALTAQFHETTILSLLARSQLEMFYAAMGSPPDPMRYNFELGALQPLIWGATARAILAHMCEDEIVKALARRELSPARRMKVDEAELRDALAHIRRDGYGISHGHRTATAVGIAAPFFDGEGRVVGSLAFLIPEFRWASAPRQRIIEALMNAAQELSRRLGHVESP